MANFYFRYGSMGAGKSIDLLKVNHNYREQGKRTILLTPSIDDRSGVGKISSRIGLSESATPVDVDFNVYEYISGEQNDSDMIYAVLVDEAQFLTKEQVIQLSEVVDYLNIPVMAFGLKNDFSNNLFEGTEALLIYADKIEEIKTICTKSDCGKKATMNLRLNNGAPVYEGEQVQIGGDESYVPVCRVHYYNY